MKKYLLMIMMVIGFTTVALAQQKPNKNAKYDVEVRGTCDMCKKRIEKAAYSVKGVKSAQWHSDDQTLHLIINEAKTTVLEVEKAVAKVGHDTKNVKAKDEDYTKIYECCRYRG